MTYPDPKDFADLKAEVEKLKAERSTRDTARRFWLPIVLATALIVVGVESYFRIPQRASDEVVRKHQDKINARVADYVKNESINEAIAQVERDFLVVKENRQEIGNLLSEAKQDASTLDAIRNSAPGIGEWKRLEITDEELNAAQVQRLAREDGFVVARITYTDDSKHHGTLAGYVNDSDGNMQMLVSNEYSRNSAGAASVMLPVQAGKNWTMKVIAGGNGDMPVLKVFWIPLRSLPVQEDNN